LKSISLLLPFFRAENRQLRDQSAGYIAAVKNSIVHLPNIYLILIKRFKFEAERLMYGLPINEVT
jgi:hypothetical protein